MTNPESVTAPALPEWGSIPFYRKLWFVGIINALGVAVSIANVLVALIFLIPGLILLWMPVYKRKKGAVVTHRIRDKIAFCIILVIVLGWNLMRQGAGGGGFGLTASLPTCESRTAQRSLKEAVKNSPKGRRIQLEIQDVVKASLASQPGLWNSSEAVLKDPQSGEVVGYLCEADTITNGGQMTVLYSVAWIDNAKSRWVVQARF